MECGDPERGGSECGDLGRSASTLAFRMSDFLSTGVQRLGVVDERVSSEGLDGSVTDDISVELKKGWEEKKGGKAVGESSISKLLQFPRLVLTLVATIA